MKRQHPDSSGGRCGSGAMPQQPQHPQHVKRPRQLEHSGEHVGSAELHQRALDVLRSKFGGINLLGCFLVEAAGSASSAKRHGRTGAAPHARPHGACHAAPHTMQAFQPSGASRRRRSRGSCKVCGVVPPYKYPPPPLLALGLATAFACSSKTGPHGLLPPQRCST